MKKTPFHRLSTILPHPGNWRKTDERPDEKKKLNGKATASALAAVTAAGVLVGGAFSSPKDIMDDGQDVVVQSVNTAPTVSDDGGPGTEELAAALTDEKRGVHAAVRRVVRASPTAVRALVAVPLWGLGTAANLAASGLWSTVLSPAATAALSWLCFALMAVLIFTLAVKTALPGLPLKKILNRRSLLTILSICLAFGLLDALLPFFWEDYALVSKLLRVLGSFVCTGVPIAFFLRRHSRKALRDIAAEAAEAPEETPPPSMAEKEAAARALIEELADSVCPRASGR